MLRCVAIFVAVSTLRLPLPPTAEHARWPAIERFAELARQADLRSIGEALSSPLPLVVRAWFWETLRTPSAAMAPTLLDRHQEFYCPKCGYAYVVSNGGPRDGAAEQPRGADARAVGGVCPICRYALRPATEWPGQKFFRFLTGDDVRRRPPQRIDPARGESLLLDKLAYLVHPPQRWDVVALTAPGTRGAREVLRVVGLPGETVRISHGDVLVKAAGEAEFRIARRTPDQVRAMLRPVYDNDYTMPVLMHWNWPARWQSWPAEARQPGATWESAADYRSFRVQGGTGPAVWLRYRHFVATDRDWALLAHGPLAGDVHPRPQLITDFEACNTARQRTDAGAGQSPDAARSGLHWVGDLAVGCTVEIEKPTGQVIFELIKGGRQFRCTIDATSGRAVLSIDARADYRPTAATPARGPGKHEILLANVDEQLLLWIDQERVRFDAPTTYPPLGNSRPRPADLVPAGIASQGAGLRLSHLQVFRDIYHVAGRPLGRSVPCDLPDSVLGGGGLTAEKLAALFSDPRRWDVFEHLQQSEFRLGADQFLVLGDNSARADDARRWKWEGLPPYVSRNSIAGKVIAVCFPYGRWLP
jgi:signal peptidase I